MRTYGRVTTIIPGKNTSDAPTSTKTWVVVQTDENGANDHVFLTTLCQVLLLYLGESPFYANYGIPAKNSVIQQIHPDFYVTITQQQFSQYFASLIITKSVVNRGDNRPTPMYQVNVLLNNGTKAQAQIPVPI